MVNELIVKKTTLADVLKAMAAIALILLAYHVATDIDVMVFASGGR